MNDVGQIVGRYRIKESDSIERPFLYSNGVASDMGTQSDLALQLENLGFHVIDIELTSINNRGEITGSFEYGKFNAMKKKFVKIGCLPFFWNGTAHVLPFSKPFQSNVGVKLNNKGICLISTDEETYLWDIESGLKQIQNFDGRLINDSSLIYGQLRVYNASGTDWKWIPAIWKNDKIVSIAELLDVSAINQMVPKFSDSMAWKELIIS